MLGLKAKNGDGFIHVTELAGYIDRQVPKLSFQAFRKHQILQMKIVGTSFPPDASGDVLSGAEAATPSTTGKPTHVVIAPTVSGNGQRRRPDRLTACPEQQVLFIEDANGWVLIARDGNKVRAFQAVLS